MAGILFCALQNSSSRHLASFAYRTATDSGPLPPLWSRTRERVERSAQSFETRIANGGELILSEQFRFVFIKGKRVGGTSVEMALSTICGAHDIVTPIDPIDELERNRLGWRARNL